MTTAIAVRDQAAELARQVRGAEFQKQVALALPGDVSSERFARAAATALLANPEIASCEPDTIFNSLLKSAQDGLLCDGREAALAKFGSQATYMPMVGGFRKIAAESGWSIKARCVYANDHFEYTEEPFLLVHNPVRPGVDRGEIIAAYAIARKRGEEPITKVMYCEDIEKRRKIAKTDNIWKQWKPEMYEKTVARDVFQDLPLGDRERVRRVLEASALEPGAAASRLYGPPTSAPEPTDASPEPPDEVSSPGTSGEGGQQVEGAEASAKSVGTGDAPSIPDDDEPPLEEESQFKAPASAAAREKRIAELEKTLVPGHDGKTLSGVGPQWITWAIKGGPSDPSKWSPEFRAAFEEWAQLKHQDLWNQHAEERAARAQAQLSM
jgi:recombination protein RecT